MIRVNVRSRCSRGLHPLPTPTCLDQLTGDHEGLLVLTVLLVFIFIEFKFFFGIIIHLLVVLAGQEVGPIAHARSVVGLLGLFASVVIADLVVKLKLLVGILVIVVDPTALALIIGISGPTTTTTTTRRYRRTLGPAQEAESFGGQIDGLDLAILVLEGVDPIGIPSLGGDLIVYMLYMIEGHDNIRKGDREKLSIMNWNTTYIYRALQRKQANKCCLLHLAQSTSYPEPS